MKKFALEFLFGTDFPELQGIRKNYEAVRELIRDDAVMELIRFQNAYDLFGFWKEGIFEVKDASEIYSVVDSGSKKYKGAIPDDRYRQTLHAHG